MKYPVYCVRDEKVGFQPQLLIEMSDNSAIRGFAFAVNQKDSIMNFSPTDYDLFKIGEFNTETGEFMAVNPKNICSGISVYGDKK